MKDNQNVVIRPAKVEDVDSIIFIEKSVWLATYSGMLCQRNGNDVITSTDINKIDFSGKSTAMIAEIREFGEIRYFVAENDASLAGYVKVIKSSNHSEIKSLYILSDFQNLGIGKELMSRAFQFIGEELPIYVDIIASNSRAKSFYEHFGFKEYGTRFSERFIQGSGKKVEILQMKIV